MHSRINTVVVALTFVIGALPIGGCTTSFAAMRSVDRHLGPRLPADTAPPFVDLAAVGARAAFHGLIRRSARPITDLRTRLLYSYIADTAQARHVAAR